MTANASVLDNVFFNGPRAGININDGFGGGHVISRNVGFNMVRETSDHGPFNSWDRNTYMWADARVGPLPILMDRNLLTCNYHCVVPIDNDDGSNTYVETNNVLLWGGSKSLMGYNKHFIVSTERGVSIAITSHNIILSSSCQNNSFVYVDYTPAVYAHEHMDLRLGGGAGFEPKPGICAATIASSPFAASGLQDQWWNNTCIASSGQNYFRWLSCNNTYPLDGVIPYPLKTNAYYSTDGSYEMKCNGETWNLTQAQSRGLDLGSSVSLLPDLDVLLVMLHDMLQF